MFMHQGLIKILSLIKEKYNNYVLLSFWDTTYDEYTLGIQS